jgi:hypothetical protein
MNDLIGRDEIGSEVNDTEWRGELRALYGQVDEELSRLAPVCELSGRCCRFAEYGHTLFVSTAEVRLLLDGGPKPLRPLDRGATCPWQDSLGRCTARAVRPLGCRVYYCDPTFPAAAAVLSERYIARLKRLTEKHGLPWNYAPLHRHLHEEYSRGRFAIELAALDTQATLT